MGKRGSVSVYLLLYLSVFLLLVSAAFMSLRYQGARVVLKTAARQSLFDLFSRYEPKLLEKYDLLFLDGSLGGSGFKAGKLLSCVEENAGICWGENSLSSNPFGLSLDKASFNSYELATDQKGEALYRQAIQAEKNNSAAEALTVLKREISEGKEQEEKGEKDGDVEKACEDYQQAAESAQEGDYEGAGLGSASGEESGSGEEDGIFVAPGDGTTQEVKKNPIETIKKLQKQGILSLVLPKGKSVSEKKVKSSSLLSGRSKSCGMGLVEAAEAHTSSDHLLFARYLTGHLSCFTDPDENAALSYQLEYVIGEKNSDQTNLKKTVKRLLLLREGANLIYLRKDSEKSVQIASMAAAISASLAVPVGEPVIEKALRVCWAYGESLVDLRTLLAGGKVPLNKSKGDWQLSLEELAKLSKKSDASGSKKTKGLGYQEYLTILLGIKNDADCLSGGMDMIEIGMRGEESMENFRLDNCIYSVGVTLTANTKDGQTLSAGASRSYEN